MNLDEAATRLSQIHQKPVRSCSTYDFGVGVFYAETDYIGFSFNQMPEVMNGCSKDLYLFCPDIVDQGVGTIDLLERIISESGQVILWWD